MDLPESGGGYSPHSPLARTPAPTIISSVQQVTVKYKQNFAADTYASLRIMIFQYRAYKKKLKVNCLNFRLSVFLIVAHHSTYCALRTVKCSIDCG